METYRYKALNEKGWTVNGKMAAQDETELHERLKAEGKMLLSASVEENKKRFRKLKSNQVADFSRSLSELLKAGVMIVRALRIIADDESTSPKERELYEEILRLLKNGTPFSDALAAQEDVFPPLFVNMIRSSENTGNMDDITAQMAEYYEKEYRLNQKIKSATFYPKMLGVLIVIVVAIIMGFVIPQFQTLFDQMETLPLSTSLLLAISGFVARRWYLIIFVAAVVYLVIRILSRIPAIALLLARIEVHLPVIGKLKKIIYTARFSRTLSSLYQAGIPIVDCLNVSKTTIGNLYIEKQFDDVITKVRSGNNLSDTISEVDGFIRKLSSSIRIGEETGALDKMLISIANQMDNESEVASQKLVQLLEPVMIVFMAVVVGFIMIAVIQPIYGSYESISNSYQ
ncbi:MAG TPA: type II secretion system F family protein [Lachnospiraceae bacterium]|nr:type II secretion system F family protein [Lachnospiraceae bacterium]